LYLFTTRCYGGVKRANHCGGYHADQRSTIRGHPFHLEDRLVLGGLRTRWTIVDDDRREGWAEEPCDSSGVSPQGGYKNEHDLACGVNTSGRHLAEQANAALLTS